jgi:hypothetical protein
MSFDQIVSSRAWYAGSIWSLLVYLAGPSNEVALKALNNSAQGNTLGYKSKQRKSTLKGWDNCSENIQPFQGKTRRKRFIPVCYPGLSCQTPSAYKT